MKHDINLHLEKHMFLIFSRLILDFVMSKEGKQSNLNKIATIVNMWKFPPFSTKKIIIMPLLKIKCTNWTTRMLWTKTLACHVSYFFKHFSRKTKWEYFHLESFSFYLFHIHYKKCKWHAPLMVPSHANYNYMTNGR